MADGASHGSNTASVHQHSSHLLIMNRHPQPLTNAHSLRHEATTQEATMASKFTDKYLMCLRESQLARPAFKKDQVHGWRRGRTANSYFGVTPASLKVVS